MWPMDSSSPRRSSPAPAGGSDRGGQESGRRPRRGGVVLSCDEDASGLNRWPGPSLLASQVSMGTYGVAGQHAVGTTPDSSGCGSPRGARPRGAWPRYGAHGMAGVPCAMCDVTARRRPATTVPMCPVLDAFFSKILNRSAQSGT
jgi:hypothetical protein